MSTSSATGLTTRGPIEIVRFESVSKGMYGNSISDATMKLIPKGRNYVGQTIWRNHFNFWFQEICGRYIWRIIPMFVVNAPFMVIPYGLMFSGFFFYRNPPTWRKKFILYPNVTGA
eukprot:TRINITY_DN13813_c0_g1_i1.p1 TRINITY_DN13813_c0_g1~~TRINITY_DN13813_c0_g1_i1.p1  ORF type:complete len:116 (-),score=16.15 TRINITY_DN13813_c0_g1_i1:375-722(-)